MICTHLFWLFPLLFIIHDLEELIFMAPWLKKHAANVSKRFPRITPIFKHYTTRGMTFAVAEELLLCVVLTIGCYHGLGALWFGALTAYTIHLFVHLVQCAVLRQYVPAVVTSIACLPFSLILMLKTSYLAQGNAGWVIAGILLVIINLIIVHKLCFRSHNK